MTFATYELYYLDSYDDHVADVVDDFDLDRDDPGFEEEVAWHIDAEYVIDYGVKAAVIVHDLDTHEVEVALVQPGSPHAPEWYTDEDVLAATRDALTWIDATLSDQWAILMVGWAASPWRADTDAKLLSADMHAPAVRHARTTILRHAGRTDQLLFHAPLEASGFSPQLIQAVVDEAEFVGALAGTPQPAQSSPLLALLDGRDGEDVAAAAKALVPASVDTLIAQGDMTMLAPGPLEPDMASFLERIAELESPGLASVWRVTEASVRRGLDGGLTAEEVHAWLGRHVMGEVPQAIAFLIDDTARTHGAIRAGSALSYIRSADPALIATAAERCNLRVLAPTVAVSDQPLTKLMAQLRAAGMQPTAEDNTGATLNMAPEPALVAATPSTLPRTPKATEEQVEAIVSKLRADSGSDADAGAGDIFETLRAAARAKRHVSVGFVDKQGRGRTLTVLPLSVSAGQVDALDEAADRDHQQDADDQDDRVLLEDLVSLPE